MRSVAIASRAPAPIPLRQAPLAGKQAPLMMTRTAKAAPVTVQLGWNVIEVKPLPAFYFLERSNVYVDASPEVVSTRIGEFLREESIAAVFHDKQVGDYIKRDVL